MANRETQVGIEVLNIGTPHVRDTQVGIEVVASGTPHVRAAQVGIEIIVPNVPNQIVPVGPLIPIQEFILP